MRCSKRKGRDIEATLTYLRATQALQLVADVHSLADQVRSKCGPKDAERTISGTLTPRFSAILENDNQVSAACNHSSVPGVLSHAYPHFDIFCL